MTKNDVYFQDPPITVEPDSIAETASELQTYDCHKNLILG